MEKGKPADHPDLLLKNTDYLMGIAGSEPVLIHATSIEIYQQADKAYITDLTFSQQGADNNLAFSGSAGTAIIDTDTNDAALSGGVVIQNHQDGMEITAESLNWRYDPQIIEGEADQTVSITYGDGNKIRGKGFFVDFKHALYEFLSIEEGILRYE